MFSKLCLGLLFSVIALAPAGIVRADGTPAKDEVVTQVKKATEFYKANGRDKTLAEMNNKDGMFAKGEDYVDVHDMTGVCVAHPVSPGIVGLNRLKRADPSGKQVIKELVETAETNAKRWF